MGFPAESMRFIGMLLTASALWGQAGFSSIPPPDLNELRFGAQLPDFEAKDTAGRTWTLADLRGKWTVIYVWGTSIARAVDAHDPHFREVIPGLPDLPEVQRFHDKVRDVANLQVLAFCRDYDYTHARDYIKERKYTFPVIADWVLLRKLVPDAGEPSYWVVNPEGRLSAPFRRWSFGKVLMQ